MLSELCFQLLNGRIQPMEESLFSLFTVLGVFKRGDAFTTKQLRKGSEPDNASDKKQPTAA